MIIIIIIYLYLHKTHQLMNLRLYLTASDGFRGSIAPCLWDAGLVLRGGKRGAGEGFMGIEWGLYILSHIYIYVRSYRHIYINTYVRAYVHTYMHSNYITQIQFFLRIGCTTPIVGILIRKLETYDQSLDVEVPNWSLFPVDVCVCNHYLINYLW